MPAKPKKHCLGICVSYRKLFSCKIFRHTLICCFIFQLFTIHNYCLRKMFLSSNLTVACPTLWMTISWYFQAEFPNILDGSVWMKCVGWVPGYAGVECVLYWSIFPICYCDVSGPHTLLRSMAFTLQLFIIQSCNKVPCFVCQYVRYYMFKRQLLHVPGLFLLILIIQKGTWPSREMRRSLSSTIRHQPLTSVIVRSRVCDATNTRSHSPWHVPDTWRDS